MFRSVEGLAQTEVETTMRSTKPRRRFTKRIVTSVIAGIAVRKSGEMLQGKKNPDVARRRQAVTAPSALYAYGDRPAAPASEPCTRTHAQHSLAPTRPVFVVARLSPPAIISPNRIPNSNDREEYLPPPSREACPWAARHAGHGAGKVARELGRRTPVGRLQPARISDPVHARYRVRVRRLPGGEARWHHGSALVLDERVLFL